MVQCPVCHSGTLVEDSEHMLCCSTCGFMSLNQAHFQSQQDEGNFGKKTKARVYRTLTEKKERFKKEKAPERPWKTDEGFQLIMMEQVDALIQLNARPELKEVVFCLWALYLKKCGRAFTEEPLSPSEKRKNFGTYRIRDKYPGTVDNPKVYPHLHVQPAINSLDESDQDKDSRHQLRLRLEAQKFLHVDEKERRTKFPHLIKKEVQAVQFMTMSKTLCFLYLGLKLTNPDVQIYDLIRWVKQERLPYLKLSFWPSEMVFYGHDKKTFITNRAPTVIEMFGEVIRLVKFMELKILDPPDIRRCARKIAYELNLPDEFIVYLDNLVVKHYPRKLMRNHFKMKIEPATFAMSYVVFALKLLLGLDDNRERKVTLLADWLSKRIVFDRPLFNFTDWMLHVQNILSYNCNDNNKKTSGRIVGAQTNVLTCKTAGKKNSLWFNKRVKYLGEFHSMLKNISKTMKSLDNHNNSDDEDDDDENKKDDDDDDDDEMNESKKKRNRSMHGDDDDDDRGPIRQIVNRGKNPFKACTLEYILDPTFFMRMLQDADAEKSLVGGDDSDGSQKALVDQLRKNLTLNNDTTSKETSNLRIKVKCHPVQEDLTIYDILKDLPLKLRPTYKPKYVSYSKRFLKKEPLVKSYAKMFAQDHKTRKAGWEEGNDEKSDSYLDILELCSKHVDVTPIYLENRLQKLEFFIFEKSQHGDDNDVGSDDDDEDDDDDVIDHDDDDDEEEDCEYSCANKSKRIRKRKRKPKNNKRKRSDDDDEGNVSRDDKHDDDDDDDDKDDERKNGRAIRRVKRRRID